MEEFAVIGLNSLDKKAEAEAILKELGYESDEDWNKDKRTKVDRETIITYKNGSYDFYNHEGINTSRCTLDQLREKVKPKKFEDVVVKVLNEEHGKEVLQAFKDLGVDTYGFTGSLVGYYYGLINGVFTGSSNPINSKVITLDQLKTMKKEEKPKYPCTMWVWDNKNIEPWEREVVGEIEYKGVKGYLVYDEDTKDFYSYRHAQLVQADPLKEVVEKLKSNSVTLTPNEAQLILNALENPKTK